jgi:hypothetical protein
MVILTSLLPASLCGRTQPIELLGKYGASFIGAETIDFVKEDSFYFIGFYCNYGVRGRGTCEIRNGYLYLYFSNEPAIPALPPKPPQIRFLGANSTAKVHITLLDTAGNTVQGAHIYANNRPFTAIDSMNGFYISSANGQRMGVSDSNVIVNLNFNTGTFTQLLAVHTAGYQQERLMLVQKGVYEVVVWMKPVESSINPLDKGEVWTYELGEIADTWFEARPGGKGAFRKYRRRYIQE